MSKWFSLYRLEWIRETVSIYGFINRVHIQRKFAVSEPQASLDLKEAQRSWPDLMTYNASTKQYEANYRSRLPDR